MKKILALIFLLLFNIPGATFAQNHLLILNKTGDTAWQLDAQTGEKIAEYPTRTAPHEVAVSPDGTRAAITNYGNDQPGSTISILDLKQQTVNKVIDITPFQRPHGIQWFSDGRRIVVSAEAQQAVVIVDTEKEEVVKSIKTNQKVSHMVQLDPNEQRVFVPNIGSGTVSVLDIADEKVIKTISTDEGTEGITLTTNHSELWVTNRAANTISVIDTETLTIKQTLQSSSFSIRAATAPNGKWIAVSNAESSEVAIFNPNTRELITKVSTVRNADENGVPIGLTFSNDSKRLYVANSQVNQIVVIDTRNWKIANRFKTGSTPDGIAYFEKP